MEIQEQKLSALLASNVSTMLYSQKNAKPQFLSFSPTSIITVITSNSYGIASLSTQLGVRAKTQNSESIDKGEISMFGKTKTNRGFMGSIIAAALITLTLTACGGGGSSTGNDDAGGSQQPVEFRNIPLMYSDTPTQNQELTISLATNEDVGEVVWGVDLQPSMANLVLTEAVDNKSITFTASEPGNYQISARSVSDGAEKTTTFIISPVLSFNQAKIDGNDGSVNLDELIGAIKNQSWIYSASLTENELQNIVSSYSEFTVIGFDAIEGLLIEYDETDISTKEFLELIKLEEGISSVENRIYEGDNVPRDEVITPNDGIRGFNDGGDNWHLEDIGATIAWDYTTGSTDILIGVSDSGFDTEHYELKGRFSEVLTSVKGDHGNGVAGAIGANTDNGKGISGINWISQMILGRSGKSNLKSILSKDKIATVNNSWAIPGYLSTSFDPSSSIRVTARNLKTLQYTRSYRKLAQSNPGKLLVWSAGNGIGNGAGNSNGVYGVDGRHHSPALHYNVVGNLQKQGNVMFVAAMRDDSRLAYYSNYGSSVDIAAPTAYKSLKINSGFYTGNDYGDGLSGFIGTSAAAPVVTGVTSLVYSLYPGFTGKEVKDILIGSATEFVTERYVAPGDAGENNSNIEDLADSIPILNAAKALEKAQEIIDSKVTVTDAIPDPFTLQARVSFKSIDEDLEVVGISWELQSSTDDGSSWVFVNGMSVNGDIAEPMLDTNTPYHRIVATVTLRNPVNNNETTATKEHEFNYMTVGVTAKDTVSLTPLSTVEVGLERIAGLPIFATGFTDSSGMVSAYLKAGTYKVRGSLAGYQEAVTSITVNGLQSLQATLNMASDITGAVGSLSGSIVNSNGEPIASASVRISGGSQTNGFFASAVTDASGSYIISNISKTDSSGTPITSFILESSALVFSTVVREEVIVLAGKERVENFTLTSQDLTGNTIFLDDFEQGIGGWTATGFWNQINLGNNTISNTLVDGGYSSLAPDETGPQASLPGAFSGDVTWWYGQSGTGSFIGTQSGSDSLLSGGTSTSPNSGQLTSPSISLVSATSPFLKVRTWWEIESVNPNENGFDLMKVQVSIDAGGSFTTIRKLNPFVDPNDSDRDHKPYSSGGFNRKPVWVLEEIDLTQYVGNNVILRFDFKTNDGVFNGFRGWVVDDVEIVDFTESAPKASVSAKGLIVQPMHLDNFSEKFMNIHKKPNKYSPTTTSVRSQ
ncbi:MAG: hypothetical protein ACI82Q_002680 [Nonlabens sp.]|jgi:hypothetical protein